MLADIALFALPLVQFAEEPLLAALHLCDALLVAADPSTQVLDGCAAATWVLMVRATIRRSSSRMPAWIANVRSGNDRFLARDRLLARVVRDSSKVGRCGMVRVGVAAPWIGLWAAAAVNLELAWIADGVVCAVRIAN